ncbi:MAG: hypothetical protein ISS81_06975 [Candidatus Marinimicrobia bacterium]|nr:hypothetical protein [Candidatus Neomarinimicrobiota bacterium]
MGNSRGVESIRTATSARVHSIPGTHRSKYLDLFMLDQEKKKLNKECSTLEKKLKKNLERIKEIEEQTKKLKHEELPKKKKFSMKNQRISDFSAGEKSKWKTMKLGY